MHATVITMMLALTGNLIFGKYKLFHVIFDRNIRVKNCIMDYLGFLEF